MITIPPTLPFAEFFSIQKPNIRLSITHKPPNTHTVRERERERERDLHKLSKCRVIDLSKVLQEPTLSFFLYSWFSYV